MQLSQIFARLFESLRAIQYQWEPQTPNLLLKQRDQARAQPEMFAPSVRYFGLGLPVPAAELIAEGIPADVLASVESLHVAVSSKGALYVVHDHWPPRPRLENCMVYFGRESMTLIRQIGEQLDPFVGKRVLDLGSGAGGLSFELGALASEVLGIEISPRAVEWARATAGAYSLRNVRFVAAAVGTAEAEAAAAAEGITEAEGVATVGGGAKAGARAGAGPWDIAVFNPPMVVPCEGSPFPHRDRRAMGIESPLLFIDYSAKHLRPEGEIYCLCTNPISHGRSVFFDRLHKRPWTIVERRCLDDRFNHERYRKEHYAEQGIERVELWYLHLKKKA